MEYTVKVDKKGTARYYKPGTDVLHREDGPAEVYKNGDRYWLKEGKWHREDGPAIVWDDGSEQWFKEGKLHREDGPAFVWDDGTENWYKEGKLHREDGPAIDYIDGRKLWYIEGEKLSEEEFKNRTKEDKVRTFTVPVGAKEIRIQFE